MNKRIGVIILFILIISIIGANISITTPRTTTIASVNTTTIPTTTTMTTTAMTTSEAVAVAGEPGDWEWKVDVGETKTYTISKFYMDQDGDGDFTQDTLPLVDEEENQVAVTLKKGTKIQVEIVDTLTTGSPASLKLTFDDNVTTPERDDYNMPFLDYSFVSQTVDNETFWEEWSEQSQAMAGQTGISVEGDLVIISSEQGWSGVNETEKFKLNWKTGWWIYGHKEIYNETHTIWEIEYSTGGDAIPGFEIVPAFLSILIATLVAYKKRR